MSDISVMLINTNETSCDATLSDIQLLRTLELVGRGCIYPQPLPWGHYNQN